MNYYKFTHHHPPILPPPTPKPGLTTKRSANQSLGSDHNPCDQRRIQRLCVCIDRSWRRRCYERLQNPERLKRTGVPLSLGSSYSSKAGTTKCRKSLKANTRKIDNVHFFSRETDTVYHALNTSYPEQSLATNACSTSGLHPSAV